MRRLCASMFLAGVVSLFGTFGSASAQTGPVGQVPGTPPAVQQPGQFQLLTNQSLPQMLQTSGYQPQQMAFPNGSIYWKITTQHNGWGYTVDVSPKRDTNGNINGFWLISDLGSTVPASNMSAQTLLNILEKNHSLAPYFFSYNKTSGKLAMNLEFINRDSNAQELGQFLTNYFNKIRDTHAIWSGNGQQANLGQVPVNPVNPVLNPVNPVPVAGVNLANTVWSGQENINVNWTAITFRFSANGQATMTTAKENFTGTWSQNGTQVSINFPGACSFTGTINGTVMTGQGQDKVGPWQFNVSLQNGTPQGISSVK